MAVGMFSGVHGCDSSVPRLYGFIARSVLRSFQWNCRATKTVTRDPSQRIGFRIRINDATRPILLREWFRRWPYWCSGFRLNGGSMYQYRQFLRVRRGAECGQRAVSDNGLRNPDKTYVRSLLQIPPKPDEPVLFVCMFASLLSN